MHRVILRQELLFQINFNGFSAILANSNAGAYMILTSEKQIHELSSEQLHALELLRSGENVFLTGGAGCGKSFVIREFTKEIEPKLMPILASTGAASVLVGGRTFHSFFGLGIMEGGPDATYERAAKDKRLITRLRKVEGFIIDEISMIPGQALMIAEALCQLARESKLPWGGLRAIAVGDFAQLPPVTRDNTQRDWCFLNPVWSASGFQICALKENHRVEDQEYKRILDQVRVAKVSDDVKAYLDECVFFHDEEEDMTRLFPRRQQSEDFNQKKLNEIPEDEIVVPTIYFGEPKFVEILKKSFPIPENLSLKVGCKLMFLQNDPQKRWINGTRGTLVDCLPDKLIVKKDRGREVQVDKSSFSYLDAEGNPVASLIQFPVGLSYATTIHKSQGATLDELWCDLRSLWEPGQAYVALSRLRSGRGLKILGWSPRSILADPKVLSFYSSIP